MLRIIDTTNKPTAEQIEAARKGYSGIWADAVKIRFALEGYCYLDVSVVSIFSEGDNLILGGYCKRNEETVSIEVFYDPKTGVGSVENRPRV